jgi:hypothetical protein
MRRAGRDGHDDGEYQPQPPDDSNIDLYWRPQHIYGHFIAEIGEQVKQDGYEGSDLGELWLDLAEAVTL